MENLTDEILMKNVRNGRLEDMSVIFDRYNVPLYNFFLRMGAQREMSEDLTQNLFYRIIKYIETWDKNEVWVRASVNINDNKDNDAYETSFDEGGKTLAVRAGFKKDYFKGRKFNCVESEISWQVFVPRNVEVSAESINADFTVTGDTGPLKIKSISGFIDLAVPESRSASLDFSTISGTIYTDHGLSSAISEKNVMAHVQNRLNSGGETIKLETISGDIFFRKSE